MSESTSFAGFPDEARVAVASSWSGGSIYDARLGRVLEQYGWKGTLFLSPDDIGTDGHLTADEVRKLVSSGHEVGWQWPEGDPSLWSKRAADKRAALESISGSGVISFAYPLNGGSRPAIADAAVIAGFQIGVTTDESDIRASNITDWRAFPVTAPALHDHGELRDRWDAIEEPGDGIFHLWGRSEEYHDDDDQWALLECNLAWFCGHLDVWYCTLAELYERLKAGRA